MHSRHLSLPRPALRLAAALLALALLAGALAAMAAARSAAPTLQLRATKVGKILVNSRGFTVYVFSRDRRKVDSCVRIHDCLAVWPILTRGSGPLAGAGVKSSLIGTIRLKGGARQLTYAGHPLYTYTGDRRPAQTSYVNFFQFGGHWPALNAAGGEVK